MLNDYTWDFHSTPALCFHRSRRNSCSRASVLNLLPFLVFLFDPCAGLLTNSLVTYLANILIFFETDTAQHTSIGCLESVLL
jgi:hypothetical protein